MNRSTNIQLFSDRISDVLRNSINDLENAGYRVQCVPCDGPPAIWYGHYEVVGEGRIVEFAKHLMTLDSAARKK